MKHSQSPNPMSRTSELQHYVHERPNLLLKMLDIAETCWHENKAERAPRERADYSEHRGLACAASR